MPKADSDKTKEQLIDELVELRQRLTALEASERERFFAAHLPDAQGQAGKENQEELMRSQMTAAPGKLARSVVHELRNPLGAIKNAAYFLNVALEEPEPEAREALEILGRNVARCEKIITNLLVSSHRMPPTLHKINIKDVIQKALLHTSVPENIKVVRQLDNSLPILLSDPDQLSQVFESILLNAILSMPEGGELTIRTKVESPDWVAVSFTDTGVGIPREKLGKVFEPLFTTRAKGIGIGLALAKTLVEAHGGAIEVKSTEGRGSTFTVRLPSRLRIDD